MQILEPKDQCITLVNTFHVDDSQKQNLLIESLRRVTVEVMQYLPGFVATKVHRSLDGQRVMNYAQWDTMDHFQAMLESALVTPHMNEIKKIAIRIDPILYQVSFVSDIHEPSDIPSRIKE